MSDPFRPTTSITSRGKITGVLREPAPAGTGQNRTSRTEQRDAGAPPIDEALYYRARLILGDSLPRPGR
jgi:hypothetical protein